jgi:hypothetical protein
LFGGKFSEREKLNPYDVNQSHDRDRDQEGGHSRAECVAIERRTKRMVAEFERQYSRSDQQSELKHSTTEHHLGVCGQFQTRNYQTADES